MCTGNYYENIDKVNISWHPYYYKYWGNMSSSFSIYSKSFASELLENLKEMFLHA